MVWCCSDMCYMMLHCHVMCCAAYIQHIVVHMHVLHVWAVNVSIRYCIVLYVMYV